jgi:hypothetical protein
MVASASVVEDRPGGRPLARFSDSCWAVEAGAPDEGRVPVVYRGSGFEVRGWVDGATGGGVSGLGGGGFGYGVLDSPHGDFEVPAGTCLYSRQGGELIGIAVDDHSELAERHGRWWLLWLATEWGELPVWVVEVAPAEGKRAAPAAPPGDDAAEPGLGGLLRRRTPIPHGPLRQCR